VSESSFASFHRCCCLLCSFVSSERALEECGLQLYYAKLHIFTFKGQSQKNKKQKTVSAIEKAKVL